MCASGKVPVLLRVQRKQRGAEERARKEGCDVRREQRKGMARYERAAKNVVRRRQVLNHDERELRVKVIQRWHVFRAVLRFLRKRIRFYASPLLRDATWRSGECLPIQRYSRRKRAFQQRLMAKTLSLLLSRPIEQFCNHHHEYSYLGKRPVMRNADVRQALLNDHCSSWSLHNVDKIDVAIPNFLYLQDRPKHEAGFINVLHR